LLGSAALAAPAPAFPSSPTFRPELSAPSLPGFPSACTEALGRPGSAAVIAADDHIEPRGLHQPYVALARAVPRLTVLHAEPLPGPLTSP